MGNIISIIEGLITFIVSAFSFYTRQLDIENGKKLNREEMYEEMVQKAANASDTHSKSVDELISLRETRKSGDR